MISEAAYKYRWQQTALREIVTNMCTVNRDQHIRVYLKRIHPYVNVQIQLQQSDEKMNQVTKFN